MTVKHLSSTDKSQYVRSLTAALPRTLSNSNRTFVKFLVVGSFNKDGSPFGAVPRESSHQPAVWKHSSPPPRFTVQRITTTESWVQTRKGSSGHKDYAV